MTLITTAEAAVELGVTATRIRQFINQGRLKFRRMGRIYLIELRDLDTLRKRQIGRPKKGKANGGNL